MFYILFLNRDTKKLEYKNIKVYTNSKYPKLFQMEEKIPGKNLTSQPL